MDYSKTSDSEHFDSLQRDEMESITEKEHTEAELLDEAIENLEEVINTMGECKMDLYTLEQQLTHLSDDDLYQLISELPAHTKQNIYDTLCDHYGGDGN